LAARARVFEQNKIFGMAAIELKQTQDFFGLLAVILSTYH
jgi:hypothetical protein